MLLHVLWDTCTSYVDQLASALPVLFQACAFEARARVLYATRAQSKKLASFVSFGWLARLVAARAKPFLPTGQAVYNRFGGLLAVALFTSWVDAMRQARF